MMASFKRNLSKIREFVKKVADYYHDEEEAGNPLNTGATWLWGGGELHAYCSNYKDHDERDYNTNIGGNAFGETYGRWEGEALNRLRNRGWIFSKALDVCICPKCAKEHGLLELITGKNNDEK